MGRIVTFFSFRHDAGWSRCRFCEGLSHSSGGECGGHDDDDVALFAKRDDVCGVGGVCVSELFTGQSDEGGQDEIGQDVFRALPHVPLLRWRGIVDLRLRDALRITFSSVLLIHFGDGLGSSE